MLPRTTDPFEIWDEYAVARPDRHLLLDLEGGGERLGEDGRVRRDGVRYQMQVLDREREILGEGAVPAHDAEHGAALAVRAPAGRTRGAGTTHRVDLPDDAAADERRRPPLDDADELVARNAGEGVVAARQLDVRVADPGADHPNERLARGRLRDRNVVPEAQATVLEPESEHVP